MDGNKNIYKRNLVEKTWDLFTEVIPSFLLFFIIIAWGFAIKDDRLMIFQWVGAVFFFVMYIFQFLKFIRTSVRRLDLCGHSLIIEFVNKKTLVVSPSDIEQVTEKDTLIQLHLLGKSKDYSVINLPTFFRTKKYQQNLFFMLDNFKNDF